MISKFKITLESTGMVGFDPLVLTRFVEDNNITSLDLFEYFLANPQVGEEAIKQGVVLPIYSIPPLDYQIIINNGDESIIRPEWQKLTTPAFPLKIESEKMVVADIYAIMDWDSTYYQELTPGGEGQAQAAVKIKSGLYQVIINGYCENSYLGSSPENKGYEFCLKEVRVLPKIDTSLDIDDINFVVYGEL
jgi:hypothetical protein